MSTVKDDLLKAADYIDEHGWCQRTMETSDGRVCLAGALNMTVRDVYRLTAAKDAVSASIHPEGGLAEWNDHSSRTKAEVVAALRTAAEQVSS